MSNIAKFIPARQPPRLQKTCLENLTLKSFLHGRLSCALPKWADDNHTGDAVVMFSDADGHCTVVSLSGEGRARHVVNYLVVNGCGLDAFQREISRLWKLASRKEVIV